MSVSVSDQGVLIIATGEPDRDRHALQLAITVKANDPFVQIALVYSENVFQAIKHLSAKARTDLKWFDFLIPCPDSLLAGHGLEDQTFWPRLYAYQLSPFRKTLLLDSHCFVFPGKRISELLYQLNGKAHAFHLNTHSQSEMRESICGLNGNKEQHSHISNSHGDVDICTSVEYFERSLENEKYYALARSNAVDCLAYSKSVNACLIQQKSLSSAVADLERIADSILSTAVVWDGMQTGMAPSSDTYLFCYDRTVDGADSFAEVHKTLLGEYSIPRNLNLLEALQKTSKITAVTQQREPISGRTEIPKFRRPDLKTIECSNIPYEVHQIWINLEGGNQLPDRYVPMVNSWFTQSTHDHFIHSHQDLLDLLSNDYPQFLDFYRQATYITEKSDICRYLLMHKYGGVYVDADMVCLQSLTPLLDSLKRPICMCIEPPQHRFWNRNLIGSAFIASKPGLDLWIELVTFMQERYRENSYPVLTTGPIIVDYFLHTKGYKSQIELLDSHYMFPTDTVNHNNRETKATICRHEWTGLDSWLARVPLTVRRSLYDREYQDIDALLAYVDSALNPRIPIVSDEVITVNKDTKDVIKSYEVALKEAQIILERKDEKLHEINAKLNEAERIIREQNEQIQQLNPALQEAQVILEHNETKLHRLSAELIDAQSYVKERDELIGKLDPALKEAQILVRERDALIRKLDPALQEAQSIVKERDQRIRELDPALENAHKIVQEQKQHIFQLENALSEAQDIAWAHASELDRLKRPNNS